MGQDTTHGEFVSAVAKQQRRVRVDGFLPRTDFLSQKGPKSPGEDLSWCREETEAQRGRGVGPDLRANGRAGGRGGPSRIGYRSNMFVAQLAYQYRWQTIHQYASEMQVLPMDVRTRTHRIVATLAWRL